MDVGFRSIASSPDQIREGTCTPKLMSMPSTPKQIPKERAFLRASEENRTPDSSLGSWGNAILRRSQESKALSITATSCNIQQNKELYKRPKENTNAFADPLRPASGHVDLRRAIISV